MPKTQENNRGYTLRALARRSLGKERRQTVQNYGDALQYALGRKVPPSGIKEFLKKETLKDTARKFRELRKGDKAESHDTVEAPDPKIEGIKVLTKWLKEQALKKIDRDDSVIIPFRREIRVKFDPEQNTVTLLDIGKRPLPKLKKSKKSMKKKNLKAEVSRMKRRKAALARAGGEEDDDWEA